MDIQKISVLFYVSFLNLSSCKRECQTLDFRSVRYAWTISICAACETQLGWLFTATNRNLKPRSFWGIRSSQLADPTL